MLRDRLILIHRFGATIFCDSWAKILYPTTARPLRRLSICKSVQRPPREVTIPLLFVDTGGKSPVPTHVLGTEATI